MLTKTKIALVAAVIVSTTSAALAGEDRDPGGYVVPGSMDGVNPAYHPDIFNNSNAAAAYGFIDTSHDWAAAGHRVHKTGTALARSHQAAGTVEKFPYNYTCQSSWFYPGYYCYEPGAYSLSYNWYPSSYAYGSYACAAAVWNRGRWVQARVC
jgi:hypothetical protein